MNLGASLGFLKRELSNTLLFALLGALGVTDRCLADRDVCELLLGVNVDTRLRREVLELDVFFGHSFALTLLFALEHFLVDCVDLVAHLACLSHAFHELLEEVLLGLVFGDELHMGHDVTTLELDGADNLGEFVDIRRALLDRLHIRLNLHHHVLEVTSSVFDVRIGWQDREVRWVYEHIRHACVLETNDTGSIINLAHLRIAIPSYIVPPRQSCDGVFNGILLSFVGWSDRSKLNKFLRCDELEARASCSVDKVASDACDVFPSGSFFRSSKFLKNFVEFFDILVSLVIASGGYKSAV